MPDKPLSCGLLADRHYGLTEGVRGLLETAFGSVVMVADDASLVDAASRLLPDVAVVDLSLARERGLGWLRVVRERWCCSSSPTCWRFSPTRPWPGSSPTPCCH